MSLIKFIYNYFINCEILNFLLLMIQKYKEIFKEIRNYKKKSKNICMNDFLPIEYNVLQKPL